MIIELRQAWSLDIIVTKSHFLIRGFEYRKIITMLKLNEIFIISTVYFLESLCRMTKNSISSYEPHFCAKNTRERWYMYWSICCQWKVFFYSFECITLKKMQHSHEHYHFKGDECPKSFWQNFLNCWYVDIFFLLLLSNGIHAKKVYFYVFFFFWLERVQHWKKCQK